MGKINEISDDYVFLLVLVDVKHKTIVAYKLVEKETEEVIYNFLREATVNQPWIGITTDLKMEYRNPITKLNFKHQFCIFHAKTFKDTLEIMLRKIIYLMIK